MSEGHDHPSCTQMNKKTNQCTKTEANCCCIAQVGVRELSTEEPHAANGLPCAANSARSLKSAHSPNASHAGLQTQQQRYRRCVYILPNNVMLERYVGARGPDLISSLDFAKIMPEDVPSSGACTSPMACHCYWDDDWLLSDALSARLAPVALHTCNCSFTACYACSVHSPPSNPPSMVSFRNASNGLSIGNTRSSPSMVKPTIFNS